MKRTRLKKSFNINVIFFVQALLFSCVSFAQQKDFVFPKTIPPFNILLSDGATYYNASNLGTNKKTILIYFDPDCEHCQSYATNIAKNSKAFTNTQIVMICASNNLKAIKKFENDYGLNKYAFIKIGTEGIYHATMNFYRVYITPFTAVYDSKGLLITYYRNVPSMNELAINLKK